MPLILQRIKYQYFPKTNVYQCLNGDYEKCSVSFEEYAATRYPPLCSYGTYIVSPNVVETILPLIKKNPFKIEEFI